MNLSFKIIHIFIFGSMFSLSICSDAMATDYIGSKDAKNFVLYLHGMDSPGPSKQERTNREVLKKIAEKLDILFALPRSESKCSNNEKLLCWEQDTIEELQKTYAVIKDSVDRKIHENSFGIIGFSNGGFFVSKLLQHGITNEPLWFLSIGSAGSWNSKNKIDLKNRSPIVILIGRHDRWHYDYAHKYANYLKEAKANVHLMAFDGGHEMLAQPIIEAIKKLNVRSMKKQR